MTPADLHAKVMAAIEERERTPVVRDGDDYLAHAWHAWHNHTASLRTRAERHAPHDGSGRSIGTGRCRHCRAAVAFFPCPDYEDVMSELGVTE